MTLQHSVLNNAEGCDNLGFNTYTLIMDIQLDNSYMCPESDCVSAVWGFP